MWRLLLTCIFLLPCCAHALNQQAISKLVEELDYLRSQQGVPAYALVISDKQKTLFTEVRGFSTLSSNTVAPQDAWFRIGSITKTFVALAALQAEKQGHLNLQDDLTALLSHANNNAYFRNPWSKKSPLKLIHLLEQTSGLTDMSKAEWDHNTPIPLDHALLKFSDQHKLQWPPGKYYSYSNTNYGLAGLAIEKATATPFEHYIEEQVFKPLGIEKIAIAHNNNVEARLITGYDSDGLTPIPYWHTIYRPLGEISVEPEEMAKLLRLFLNRGDEVFNKKIITRMETPHSSLAAQAGLEYGYGPGLYDWFRNGYRFYGHGGDGDGYLAHFAYQRESGLAYFLVINSFQGSSIARMRARVEQAFIADLPKAKFVPEYNIINPQHYTGSYQPASWRFGDKPTNSELRIFLKKNQLYAQFTDYRGEQEKAYPLIAVNDNLFRWRSEPDASMAIIKTDQGMLFSGDEGNFLKAINPVNR
ncbi:serine hydrolase [Oceanicoccus sp. KOV_DT_Chl]|uniref:serine hydrolase domain-containing protein n=1 Tax=Oceanicoccus sp. KOV_DT_Chl TaxID=1904639 RepID=UPI000C7AA905|nr:serine hydrolase domain-containing protein [Oceanicoccus sp. KOV_DT_Chl]